MSGRKVFVSSDMSVDERLLLVSERNGMASLLWPWLLTAFDDWGRCEATPLRLKARIWPMNDTVSVALVSEALELFSEVGMLERYVVDERAYVRVPPARWWKWQTHIHREKREEDKSRIPAPDGEQQQHAQLREDTREQRELHATARESAQLRAVPRNSARSRGSARDSVDLSPEMISMEYARLPRSGSRSGGRADDAQESIQRRADYRDSAPGGGWAECGGGVPPARHQ